MKLFIVFLLVGGVFTKSLYTLSSTDRDGRLFSFSSTRGKHVLLVNIATESPRATQLIGLQKLQDQFNDSLIVVAFPSHSFGRESRDDEAIRRYCDSLLPLRFPIMKKTSVIGETAHEVYRWLSQSSENGELNIPIRGDFQKILIDPEGVIIGIFMPEVDPLDPIVLSSISKR